MLHAVIMAGGAGTRFWPASTSARPKQLLPLAGERTMIQATVDRLKGLVAAEHVLIVTNQRLVEPIRHQLPELSAAAILGEPAKRDTAPCIGLAAIQLAQSDPDATMAVMPSDHVIRPTEVFQEAIRLAARLVDESPSRIVTFGIPPTYPAEIFGYIERGESIEVATPEARAKNAAIHDEPAGALKFEMKATSSFTQGAGRSGDLPHVFRVARFREKPNRATAEEYLASGKFLWNAGIFVWKARHIMEELAAHEPEMFAHLQRIATAAGTPKYIDVLRDEFTAIQGKSIDYAVMERASDIVVIEAPFEWDDVGSWQSLARLRGADDNGNTIAAKRHAEINTKGCIISADPQHLIVTVGALDLIIVQVDNVTMVANKHDEEAIRAVTKLLQERGLTEYL